VKEGCKGEEWGIDIFLWRMREQAPFWALQSHEGHI
jgi:hypothetical protein